MSGLAAVLFDLDGTLITTEEVWNDAISIACATHGVEVPRELLVCTSGLDIRTTLAVIGRALDHDLPPETADVTEGLVAQLLRATPQLVPGARELLAELAAAQLPTALVTSTRRALVRSVLPGLGHHFDVVVCGDDVAATKPDPEPYLTAAAALGVSAVDCVAFEDSSVGVASATAAGCTVIMQPCFTGIDLAHLHRVADLRRLPRTTGPTRSSTPPASVTG